MEMVLLETLEREGEEQDDAKVAINVVGKPGNEDGDATNGGAEGVSVVTTVQTPVSVVGDSAEKAQGEVKVVTRPVSSTGARVTPPFFPGAKVTPLDAPVSSPAAVTDYAHVDSICSLLCNKAQTPAPALVHEKAKEFDDYAFKVHCSISFAAQPLHSKQCLTNLDDTPDTKTHDDTHGRCPRRTMTSMIGCLQSWRPPRMCSSSLCRTRRQPPSAAPPYNQLSPRYGRANSSHDLKSQKREAFILSM